MRPLFMLAAVWPIFVMIPAKRLTQALPIVMRASSSARQSCLRLDQAAKRPQGACHRYKQFVAPKFVRQSMKIGHNPCAALLLFDLS